MVFSRLRKLGKFCSKRVISAVLLAALVTAVLTVSAMWQFKTVTVRADGKTFTVTTTAKSAETVLSSNGITLSEGDEVTPSPDEELQDNAVISVTRAFPVKVTLGTDSFVINTTPKPLNEVLESNGIALYEHDIVTPGADTFVTPDTEINIVRVFVGNVSSEEVIPYTREFRANASMEQGDSKIVTPGENGKREAVYRVTTTNGEETARELVSENVTKEPVTEIVEYGTHNQSPLNRTTPETAQVLADCSYIDCKAYSYILSGKTATGMKTQRGLIAVDPRVIPLGTKVYVQSLDGKADYGYAIAADTGGAIKGNTIDMWVPTYAEAAQNGVRKMRVYILPQ